LARCGGFGVARRIAIDASTRGVQVVPHCWSSDILVAATIHFLSSLDQLAPLEFNVMNQPLRTELVVNPIRPCDGKVRVPDGVGLGIELNLDTVEKFRVK
jgi:L-alanine-DL-glutamate epimerase-like enolase superfamily enzyme